MLRSTFVLAALLLVSREVSAQQPPPPEAKPRAAQTLQQIEEVPEVTQERPMSFWMAHKLEFSKSILQSLTLGEFEQLSTDAKQMRLLGKIESFIRRKNPDYRVQVRNFDIALGELIRASEQGNITGATVAFNQMTTSCVACHALLREGID